jgi:PPP family 3-phenylpropionic acid transporter
MGAKVNLTRGDRLGLHTLFVLFGVAEAAILPFFPLLLRERGLSFALIGLILSAMSFAGFVANPAWGYAADVTLGSETALTLSAAGAAILSPLLLLTAWTPVFLALALALAVFRAPVAALTDAIALRRLGEPGRTQYGRVRLWMSGGFALAAVLFGLLLEHIALPAMLWTYSASAVAVALWTKLVMSPSAVPLTALKGPEPVRARRALAESKDLVWFLLELLVLSAAFVAAWNFVSLRIVEVGGGPLIVGVAAGIQAVAEIPVMRLSPQLARRASDSAVFVAGCVLYAVGFAAWAWISDPLLISLVRIVVGFGFAFVYVGSVLIVDGLVPDRLKATGQGLAKAVSFGLAPIVGALGGGLVYDALGAGPLFLLTGAVAAAAAISHGVRFRISRAAPRARDVP